MRITIETTEVAVNDTTHKVIVETNNDDYTIYDLLESVVMPLLIAYGYHEDNVHQVI